MNKNVSYYLLLILFLISANSKADQVTLVPTNTEGFSKVSTGDASDVVQYLEFWADILNTKIQFDRVDQAREKIAATIPKGEKEKYDMIVQGKEFLYFVKHNDDVLVGGKEPHKRLLTTEISGTAPTKAEIEEAKKKELAAQKNAEEKLKLEKQKKIEEEERKADRERELDRDTQRIRSEIENFKRSGGNFRAPAV